jgi:hypothetical protein
MKAGHRYRVVGVYDNPTGQTLVKGAMAHMAGLFVPDDLSDWPKIDPANAEYQRDLTALQVRGHEAAPDGHGGHGESHNASASGGHQH